MTDSPEQLQWLDDLAGRVGLPDEAAAEAARERQRLLTKPPGALGRLEDLSIWWCGVRGECPAPPPLNARLVIFAGDHGVAQAAHTSAYPSEVTAQMVLNMVAGGAAANVLAEQVGASVRVLDVAVDVDWAMSAAPIPPAVVAHKVRRSSEPLNSRDALSSAEVAAAFRAGCAVADEEVDAGADLLIAGDMGIGNTTAAAAVIGALTNSHAATVVGRGTGIDDETWMRKAAAVRDGLFRARDVRGDPLAILAALGGADVAALSGFLLTAAARRTPVILDGMVVGAAALAAHAICYRARNWWLAGHRSVEPAHALVLDRLRLEPVVDYQMRLGEGSGALVALSMLRCAAATLADMATFASAGVSDRDDSATPS